MIERSKNGRKKIVRYLSFTVVINIIVLLTSILLVMFLDVESAFGMDIFTYMFSVFLIIVYSELLQRNRKYSFLKCTIQTVIFGVLSILPQVLPTFFLSYGLFEDIRLTKFVNLLYYLILFRVYAIFLDIQWIKILLNILRFIVILIIVFAEYGNFGLPDIGYMDRAILASLTFDTILNSINVHNFSEWLRKKVDWLKKNNVG